MLEATNCLEVRPQAQGPGLRGNPKGAGAVDCPVVDEGLREVGAGRGRLGREDGDSVSHLDLGIVDRVLGKSRVWIYGMKSTIGMDR